MGTFVKVFLTFSYAAFLCGCTVLLDSRSGNELATATLGDTSLDQSATEEPGSYELNEQVGEALRELKQLKQQMGDYRTQLDNDLAGVIQEVNWISKMYESPDLTGLELATKELNASANGNPSIVESKDLLHTLKALQFKLSVHANNLLNQETTAFKRRRVITQNHVDSNLSLTTRTECDFRQGPFKISGRELDAAIEGKGFFQVTDSGSGEALYTRNGRLNVNANGQLVVGSAVNGHLLEPPIVVPQDATGIVITSDGQVFAKMYGVPDLQGLGQLQLASFVNQSELLRVGNGLYAESSLSGVPTLGNPGQQGLGVVRQGTLEGSNVEPYSELTSVAQTLRQIRLVKALLSAPSGQINLPNQVMTSESNRQVRDLHRRSLPAELPGVAITHEIGQD